MQAAELLKNHGLRKTKGRLSVLQCFLQYGKALSHADISERLPAKMDRVTLYRILQSFESQGLIHKVPDDQLANKYALCDHQHDKMHAHTDNHAHFKCQACGETICLEQSAIPQIHIPQGFQVAERFLLLSGLCKACAA